MCIILDANILGKFLAEPPNPDAKPVRDWLERGWGQLVYSTGGAFEKDVHGKARDRLAGFVRAGRARQAPAARLGERERELRERGIRSDDPHVLALALEAGVRLLYTADRKLMDDFRDPKIVNRPRGKVYSGAGNKRLLTRTACRPRQ